MRLKTFEFDIANSQLFDLETQSSFHLTRTECQVLEQLANHPNQVMSKGQLACAGSQTAVMSESAVAKAVFTLRKYFGEQHEELIETLPRKGYRLNIQAPTASWAKRSKARKKYLILTVVALVLSCVAVVTAMHQYILFESVDALFKTSRNIVLDNGEEVQLTWLESPRIRLRQEVPIEEKVIAALNRCPHLTWQTVNLAFSNDMQVLNVSMQAKSATGETLMRNIKTIDFSLSPEFISEDWLEEVSLCD